MKRKILASVLAVCVAAIVLSSCTKEEVKPSAEGGMSAKRDKL